LDRNNTSVYKQLYRAAKAKQKLKLRISTDASDLPRGSGGPKPATVEDEAEVPQSRKPAAEVKSEQPLISLSPPSRPLQDLEEALDRLESTMSLNEATEAMKKEHEKITRNLDILEASVNALSGGLNRTGTYGNGCELRRFPTLGSGLFGAQGPLSRCPASSATCTYAVCCNICDKTIPGAHYHCSTCDDGDFDLCQECVDQGETCKGSDHWLIKRFVKDGAFINSTTERIPPKPKAPQTRQESPAPAAPVLQQAERVVPVLRRFVYENMRTCNSCVSELPESDFVHCDTCEDFDLCKTCFTEDKHGHHPKHAFSAASKRAVLEPDVSRLLAPGRNETHNAICDGCDKTIRGVRHKCLDCPDWDYCNNCIVDAAFVHPDHRFVPVYEQLEAVERLNARAYSRAYHVGICCDGPLCQSRPSNYIVGDRYKCAVCHDTDFCANCEASPANAHNKTHPLIKFKTPVKYVTVSTSGARRGQRMPMLGDQPQLSRASTSSRATETTAAKEDIVKTEVQTVADVKPDTEVKEEVAETSAPAPAVTADDLVAVYSRDTITDGTVLPPNHVFAQTWYLRNEGTVPWPANCAVKFVGGDYMGCVDPHHPAGVYELADANLSAVCSSAVAPGEEVPFTVLLRTPAREGKVISYWRLTTKEGMKFGHRLWCDINVQTPKYEEEVKSEPVEEKEIAKEVSAVDSVEEEPKAESTEASSDTTQESQMIFPKLEKESPEASIHHETPAETEAPPAYEEEYEECSHDDDWAEEESDAGFLTDEEYDVLDASDEEYLEEQQKKLLKK
jgi:next-to-BRCA1 protein 1